jgi:hypothetical protein
MGRNADKQIELLKEKCHIDWNDYSDGEKYGRLIYKEQEDFVDEVNGNAYVRNVWKTHEATPFGEDGSIIRLLIPVTM